MALLGQLVVKVTGDATQFDKTIDTSHKKFSGFGGKIRNISLGVGAALLGIGAAALKASADMEQQLTAFSTLLGSGEKAKKLLEELEVLGAKTPLQLESLTQNANVLLQYGINAENVTDTLRTLGDVAQGNAAKLGSMTLAFAQIGAAGKANMQDIRQMINAGFNPLTVIAEKTGESMDALAKRVSAGKVSFDEINEAFKTATSEGGRFFNAMEAQSQTFAGRLSTLQDNITIMARKLGDLLLPVAGKLITVMSQLVDEISKNDEFFGSLANAIGKIGEIIVKLLPVISKLLTAIAPIISAVANLAAELIDALYPVIELVADVFSELAPIIARIVSFVGTLVKVFGRLLPILTKIVQPLLKPLFIILNLLLDLLQPIIDLFEEFTKLLDDKFIKVITDVVGFLIKMTVPLLGIIEGLKALGIIAEKDEEILDDLGDSTDELKDKMDSLNTVLDDGANKPLPGGDPQQNKEAIDGAQAVADKLTSIFGKSVEERSALSAAWEARQREELEKQEEAIKKYVDLGKTYFGDLFSSLGEALVTGQDGWVAFAQTAVMGIAAVIDALANEALAQAAAEFAKGLAAAASVLFAATAPGHFSASAAWAAAGAAGKIGAGIVRGLASQIKLAEGGLIMPRAGGTVVTAGEAGVPEYYLPERQDILSRLADKITANMGNTTNITNNNIPGTLTLRIGNRDIDAYLTDASRDGRFLIDRNRGLSR